MLLNAIKCCKMPLRIRSITSCGSGKKYKHCCKKR